MLRGTVFLLALLLSINAMAADNPKHKTALVIHGGAGVSGAMSPEEEAAYKHDLDRALDAGNAILQKGGSAVDAVVAAIVVMEESPLFNAGKGSVYDAKGGHELDASIMGSAAVFLADLNVLLCWGFVLSPMLTGRA